MSLDTSVNTARLDKQTARHVGEIVSQKSGLDVRPRISWLRRTCDGFDLPGVNDMLTDDADWDADIWDMDKAMLPSLALAVDEIARHLDRFTFRVAWMGESTLRKTPIGLSDLVSVIRENKIENRVEYEVTV